MPLGASGLQSLRVGAMTRTYWLHIPRGYRARTPQPLVMLFHGHGMVAQHFEQYTGFSHVADTYDFIAVYPQGALGPGGHTGWNTYRAYDPHVNDLRFIQALVPHLESELCVSSRRIYAAGFSNGGGFTGVLACAMSRTFAAAAVVSGDFYPLPTGCHPSRPISLLEIHGTADTINPYDGSKNLRYPSVESWVADWAVRDDCVGSPAEHDVPWMVTQQWGACPSGVSVEHVGLLGGVHVWPRQSLPPSEPVSDRAFDATQVIWTFFAAHARPTAANGTTARNDGGSSVA